MIKWETSILPGLTRQNLGSDEIHLWLTDTKRESRSVLRTILSHYAPVTPSEWIIATNPFGRPEIPKGLGFPPPTFNLSHTQGLLACGIACDREIGIDVEYTLKQRNWKAVAESRFHPEENEILSALSPAEAEKCFYRLWTLKEAYLKAIGKGLACPEWPLSRLRFRFGPDGQPVQAFTPELPGSRGSGWAFRSFSPSPMHMAGLAFSVSKESGTRVV